MKPRWLAFALTLPTDDVLFVQYTVPTIVMSRQCDQHSKVVLTCTCSFRLSVLSCSCLGHTKRHKPVALYCILLTCICISWASSWRLQ